MYDKLVSLENVFTSWKEFRAGKQNKADVQLFERFLEDNLFIIQEELENQTYRHGGYKTFHIQDPKPRMISKAIVKDRLVHHLVFRKLYDIFDSSFIFHSYSSREKKGSHLAVKNLSKCLRKVSKNYTCQAYVLKCDIRKFFLSMNHKKLLELIERIIFDKKFLWLVEEIINSFSFPAVQSLQSTENIWGGGDLKDGKNEKRGLPIGNITSQIFANIYLNELDWFIERKLKVKNYFRYADDFVIVHAGVDYLEGILLQINTFLKNELKLDLHPRKVEIRKFSQGIDFLGYIILPHYILLRTKTKKRMFRKISTKHKLLQKELIPKESFNQSAQSYLGMLNHCEGYKIKKELKARIC